MPATKVLIEDRHPPSTRNALTLPMLESLPVEMNDSSQIVLNLMQSAAAAERCSVTRRRQFLELEQHCFIAVSALKCRSKGQIMLVCVKSHQPEWLAHPPPQARAETTCTNRSAEIQRNSIESAGAQSFSGARFRDDPFSAMGRWTKPLALESAERIAGGEGTCGGCDQGIHGERLHHRVWVRRACEISWTQACTTCSPASICLDFPPTYVQGDGADHGRGYTFVSHGHKRVLFVDSHGCHECNVVAGRAILVGVADQ